MTGLALFAIAIASCVPSTVGPVALFDGKTLDGWRRTAFYKAGEVKVEGGVIVLAEGPSMTGITTTQTGLPATNYELSYEAMRTSGEDFFAAATFPVGSSFLTFVNGGWGGNITGLSSINGADASENETGRYVKYRNQVWYRFRVRVTNAVVRCWVDDREVVALNPVDKNLSTRLETRPNQPLGFATWKSAGAIRKIEIRRLSPVEAAAEPAGSRDD